VIEEGACQERCDSRYLIATLGKPLKAESFKGYPLYRYFLLYFGGEKC